MEVDKVVIIVINSKNEFFVHQRSVAKKMFPLKYGLGAGGHIETGEMPQQAAKRELYEELEIEADPQFLFKINFISSEVSHLVHIFKVKYDGKPKQCDEFRWSGWMTLRKVEELAENEELCPDTKIIFNKFKEV